MKRSRGTLRLASIAASKLAILRSPQPSQPRISASRRDRRKMSAGLFTRPSSNSFCTFSAPSPSISMALRRAKWIRRSTVCAGHTRPPVQRFTTSPGGRTAWLPQAGQVSGKTKGFADSGRFSMTTPRICGITSPARWRMTVSPMRTSFRAISSSLCRLAWVTMTPPTPTGCITARGVSAPVRPTWISISSSTVVACSAGNFHAIAQRGARPTKPRRRCQSSRFSL